MLYDDASWHAEGGVDVSGGATHIGLFLAWMLLNGHGSGIRGDAVERLRQRQTTPGAWLLEHCGAKLSDREFSPEGNRFAAGYYAVEDWRMDEGAPSYLTDYRARMMADGDVFAVADDWSSYDRLAPILAHRFALWRGLEQGRS